MRQHLVLPWLVPLLLALPPRPTERGVVIVGQVTDENMKPLAAATVYASPTNRGASTDANGSYVLTLPAASVGDSVTLVARLIGYVAGTQNVRLTRDTMR